MRMISRVQIILPRRIRPDLVAIIRARDIEIDVTGAGGVGRLYRDITLNSQILLDSRRRSGSVITTSQGSYKNLITTFQISMRQKKKKKTSKISKRDGRRQKESKHSTAHLQLSLRPLELPSQTSRDYFHIPSR